MEFKQMTFKTLRKAQRTKQLINRFGFNLVVRPAPKGWKLGFIDKGVKA